MKKNLRLLGLVAVGAAASLGFSSCAYDPYYGSTSVGGSYSSGGDYSVGGSYSSGYGDGYGYGGRNFSTSVFVSTGDPRWGYDPYCYSYYDYSRRAYYDPYLNGYYPIGYRPAVVYGVPHPYGWSAGHGYCPPPRQVRNITVVNYRNREAAYHNTNYGWARQVRQQAPSRGSQQQSSSRPVYNSRPQTNSSNSGYQKQSRPQTSQPSRSSSQSSSRQQSQSRYNSPVTTHSSQSKNTQHGYSRPQAQPNQRPQLGNPGNSRSQPVPQQSRPQSGKNKGQSNDDDGKRIRGYR